MAEERDPVRDAEEEQEKAQKAYNEKLAADQEAAIKEANQKLANEEQQKKEDAAAKKKEAADDRQAQNDADYKLQQQQEDRDEAEKVGHTMANEAIGDVPGNMDSLRDQLAAEAKADEQANQTIPNETQAGNTGTDSQMPEEEMPMGDVPGNMDSLRDQLAAEVALNMSQNLSGLDPNTAGIDDGGTPPPNPDNTLAAGGGIPPTPPINNTLRSGTMSLDELAAQTIAMAKTAGNIAQTATNVAAGIANTVRSATMNMDELADHIAKNGSEKPFVTAGQQKAGNGVNTPNTAANKENQPSAEQGGDSGMLMTEDSFANQYKPKNYWDSDERKKEWQTVVDAFNNAKDIDDFIINGGFALLNLGFKYATAAIKYTERYDKEKADFTRDAIKAYDSDILTKHNISTEQHQGALDLFVYGREGLQDDLTKANPKLMASFPKQDDGSLDFGKFTPEQQRAMGEEMKKDPATRAHLSAGIENLMGRIPSDKEMDILIMGCAGNKIHATELGHEAQVKIDQRQKTAPDQTQGQAPAPTPGQTLGQTPGQTQGMPATPMAPQRQGQQSPTPTQGIQGQNANAPQIPGRATHRTSTPNEMPVPPITISGNLKNVTPPVIAALGSQVRSMGGTLNGLGKEMTQNRMNFNMIEQARRNPPSGGNAPQPTYTMDLGLNR